MYKILSYWLIPSRPKKSFTYTSTSACGKSYSSCRFSFSVARNTITKVFRFFFSYFGFLLLLGKVWTSLSVIKRYGFFNVLAAIIWKNSDKRPWIENGEGFAVRSLTWLSVVGEVSAADWRYQTHVKNTVFFQVCSYGFSQGWKSLYNTVVYMIKIYSFVNGKAIYAFYFSA